MIVDRGAMPRSLVGEASGGMTWNAFRLLSLRRFASRDCPEHRSISCSESKPWSATSTDVGDWSPWTRSSGSSPISSSNRNPQNLSLPAGARHDGRVTLHRIGGPARSAGIALFEAMIEMDAYGARETLAEVDGRFSAAQAVVRRRRLARKSRRSRTNAA